MAKITEEIIAGTIEKNMNEAELKDLGINTRNLNDLKDYNDEDCMSYDN
jgi:hypothetical protein